MLNRCKFLSVGLNLCSITGTGCSHMADPDSCPNYDEESDRPYHTPSAVAPIEETESLTEFTDRIEGELDGMGIKVERGEIEDIEEEAPDWF